MTYLTKRQALLWFNIILATSHGDLVEAYDILLRELATRSISFGLTYGAARCAKTFGEYLFGPLADVPIICDYVATCLPEEILERGSKLVAGSVSVISTATSEYIDPDIASGAAGRVAGEMVNMCEQDLKSAIARVMKESNETSAWMEKYILGDDNLGKLRGGCQYFEPNQNRYFIIKIIGGVLIVVLTITLIRCKSKVGKFFKKIHPKKLYASFKTRRHKKFLKDKERLELLYAM